MTRFTPLIGAALLTWPAATCGQTLEDAEVRLPYGELKRLLTQAEPAPTKPARPPALLSARLKLAIEDGRAVIDASFRATGFSADELAMLPLLAGELALAEQDPEDAVVLIEEGAFCLGIDSAGTRTVRLKLLPVMAGDGFTLKLPPCPAAIFETAELTGGVSVMIERDGNSEPLTSGQLRALPNTGCDLRVRILDESQTREMLRPVEASEWTWQQQALVLPEDGGLVYQVLATASADGGSGIQASLPMPADAREIEVTGEDLTSQAMTPGQGRQRDLALVWKTRGLLDRQVMIRYRMPLRPLDESWTLEAPGNGGTRTRFIIAAAPLLQYSADGLSAALTADGLPSALGSFLNGGLCHDLEGDTRAVLKVTRMPVAATAEGVVSRAEWSHKVEPDGAMLVTGLMAIDHKGPVRFPLDTPEGMTLLSCEVSGKPVSPVDLGGGLLGIPLAPQDGTTTVSCTFTAAGSETGLDPVEGVLGLSLPRTPFFIHSLSWSIQLPAGYQAETHGNLTRTAATAKQGAAQITLGKNLCRDERPAVRVFYQRGDLNR
jgi:hypothetical protein